MKTIQKNTYSFSELGEKAQKNVIERERKLAIEDFDYLEGDYFVEWAKEDLEKNGWENVKIFYSGFWSQGDGASFTGSVGDLQKVLLWAGIKEEDLLGWRLVLREFTDGEINIIIEQNKGNRYVHKNSVTVYANYSGENPTTEKQLEDLEKLLTEKKNTFCDQLYKSLEDSFYRETSDERIKERLLEQDGEEGERYFEDGSLIW